MPVLAVIPARLGATRLSRKPLRLIGGQPLVVRVWQRVHAMRVAEAVVVATDSQEIVDAVYGAGGMAVLTDPGHPSGTDRAAEVSRRPEYERFDVILNVQGDEPFVSADAVPSGKPRSVTIASAPRTASARAGHAVLGESHVVKVVCGDDGRALYFSRAAIPFLREAEDGDERDTLVRQHLGIYAYTCEGLAAWVRLAPHPLERVERLEQLRPLAAGMAMGVATIDEPPMGGVDTEADLARANALWDDLYAGHM